MFSLVQKGGEGGGEEGGGEGGGGKEGGGEELVYAPYLRANKGPRPRQFSKMIFGLGTRGSRKDISNRKLGTGSPVLSTLIMPFWKVKM